MVFYLLRYAEIGIKGKNRSFFERILINNIKKLNKDIDIKKSQGRLIAQTDKKINFKHVFGLSSYSCAVKTDIDIISMAKTASSLKEDLGKFRVSCQRSDKRIPLKSIDVEKEVGAILFEKGGIVSLKNFDTEICIELVEGSAFVFVEKISCFGGLPVGSQSKVAVLLQSKIDVLAGLFALKRGCSLIPICYGFDDSVLLEKFSADKSIKLNNLEELDDVLKKNNCLLLYSGQREDDFFKINVECPVIRPLVFQDDKEIEEELIKFRAV